MYRYYYKVYHLYSHQPIKSNIISSKIKCNITLFTREVPSLKLRNQNRILVFCIFLCLELRNIILACVGLVIVFFVLFHVRLLERESEWQNISSLLIRKRDSISIYFLHIRTTCLFCCLLVFSFLVAHYNKAILKLLSLLLRQRDT